MPRVEAYGQQRVRTNPIAGVKDTRDPQPVLGNVAGAALKAVAPIYLAERERADQVALIAADNQLSAWENQRLYDPEKGAFAVRGKDALALPDALQQEYDQVAGKIEAGLSGNRQKLAFQRQRANRWQSIDLSIKRHVFTEQRAYDEQETKAFIDLSQSNAIANFSDLRRVSDELQRGAAAIADHAKRNGLGPQQAADQVLAFQSGIHAGVIDRYLSADQAKAAAVYFEETKGQISGDAQARIQKAIEVGTLRGEAQRQGDAIMAGSTSMTDALERARAITDPELRDQVQQRVEHDWAVRKQAARESAENIMVTAANLIDKGGMRAVPPTLWSQLEPGQRTSLESYAKRNQVGGDAEGKTDLATYYGLMQTASTDPTKFAQTNLLMYLGKLGKTEFKQLTELQNSVRKGDTPKVDATIDSFTTKEQVFTDILAEHSIEKDDPKALTLRRELDRRVEQAQVASGGKKLTHTEIRDMADQLIGSVVLERGGWTNILPGGKPFFDQTKPVADLTIADIPAAEKRSVVAALQKAGRPVTDATVLDWYIRAKRKAGDIQ